jgi:hypothetical protein
MTSEKELNFNGSSSFIYDNTWFLISKTNNLLASNCEINFNFNF